MSAQYQGPQTTTAVAERIDLLVRRLTDEGIRIPAPGEVQEYLLSSTYLVLYARSDTPDLRLRRSVTPESTRDAGCTARRSTIEQRQAEHRGGA